MKHISVVVAAVLLLLMAVLSGGAARRESVAVDEVSHIGAGVSYLQKLDLRMNPEHPPLAKVLATLPLVLRGVRADYSDLSWSVSGHGWGNMLGEWSWGHAVTLQWNDPYSTVWWARVPMLLLTLALGLLVYWYAGQLGGAWGGLLCLAVFVSTPTFLTFGPLVLTDITVTFFSLATLWSFASLWRAPSRRALLPFGLLFGASLLSKFSAGILLFGFLFYRLSLRFSPLPGMPTERSELGAWRRLRGRYMWKGIFIAALTVYAVYLVLSWNQPSDSLPFLGHGSAALVLRRLLMPVWVYLRGLFFFAVGASRPTFLLGRNYSHGVWFYFPVVFVLKSTLAFLLMLVLAIPLAPLGRRERQDRSTIPSELRYHWRAICVFLLVFVAFCMLSRMTISIRHFTIPIVLLILLLAPVPRLLWLLHEKGSMAARVLMATYALLALFSLLTVIRAYPYFMPFLNSLSFGRPAYALVTDSNLDWNQALPEVERYVKQHGLPHVLLDEYGFNDPTIYVPQAELWNCQEPLPSAGGQVAVVSGDMLEDAHNCPWLLQFPHEALAAGGMYVFQLPAVLPPAGSPGGPPTLSELHSFGMPMPGGGDARLIFLDCIRDPRQLQPTMDHITAEYEAQRQKH